MKNITKLCGVRKKCKATLYEVKYGQWTFLKANSTNWDFYNQDKNQRFNWINHVVDWSRVY